MTDTIHQTGSIPQFSTDAELQVVSGCLTEPEILDEVEFLKGDDFYDPTLGRIFSTMLAIHAKGDRPTVSTLVDQMRAAYFLNKLFIRHEGHEYRGEDVIHFISSIEPNTSGVADDAMLVHKYSIIRKAGERGRLIWQDAIKKPISDVNAWINQHSTAIATLAVEGKKEAQRGEKRMESLDERLCAVCNDDVQEEVIETSFHDLDQLISESFKPGRLLVAASRPGGGKTSLAMDVARAVKRQGIKVLYFSLEVTEDELTTREVAAETGLDPKYFLHEKKRDKVFRIIRTLYGSEEVGDLFIDDTRRDMRQIASYSLAMQRREGIGFVVVDHLGLVKHPNANLYKEQQVSDLAIGFKEMAMRMKIPVLLLSQLNRQCEARPDKRPQLSDLRSSGEIEQSADVVMMLYRDVMYNPWHESELAELNVLKNRSGQVGRVYMRFWSECTTFVPMDQKEIEQELKIITPKKNESARSKLLGQ